MSDPLGMVLVSRQVARGEMMQLWYETGDLGVLQKLSSQKIICVDVETTGTHPAVDEVLQVVLLRGDGAMLFSQYFKPEHHKSWISAQRINGISPAMVQDCPSIKSCSTTIEQLLVHASLIVGYNLPFDLSFLRAVGIRTRGARTLYFDVMREFAPVAGYWDRNCRRYAWVPLTYCARHYGCIFQAHDALEDARATLHCFRSMLEVNSDEKSNRQSRTYLDIVARYGKPRHLRGE